MNKKVISVTYNAFPDIIFKVKKIDLPGMCLDVKMFLQPFLSFLNYARRSILK